MNMSGIDHVLSMIAVPALLVFLGYSLYKSVFKSK